MWTERLLLLEEVNSLRSNRARAGGDLPRRGTGDAATYLHAPAEPVAGQRRCVVPDCVGRRQLRGACRGSSGTTLARSLYTATRPG